MTGAGTWAHSLRRCVPAFAFGVISLLLILSACGNAPPTARQLPAKHLPTKHQVQPAEGPAWIQMSSAQEGWGVASSGAILVTSNGGESWTKVGPRLPPGFQLQGEGLVNAWEPNGANAFFFLNAEQAWVAAWSQSAVLVFATKNRGASWTRSRILLPDSLGSNDQLFFTSSQTGYLVIGPPAMQTTAIGILATANGGATWHVAGKASGTSLSLTANLPITRVIGFSAGAIWAVNSLSNPPQLFVSLTGGLSWAKTRLTIPAAAASLPITAGGLISSQSGAQPVVFMSASSDTSTAVWTAALGSSEHPLGSIFSWSAASLSGSGGPVPYSSFGSGGVVAAGPSTLAVSVDAGRSWQTVQPASSGYFAVYEIDFVNALDGWALSSSSDSQPPSPGLCRVLHTTDGGVHWTCVFPR
ncbi:MAG: hypothetical protein ACYCOS_02790 [Sulfobacillus sp.]